MRSGLRQYTKNDGLGEHPGADGAGVQERASNREGGWATDRWERTEACRRLSSTTAAGFPSPSTSLSHVLVDLVYFGHFLRRPSDMGTLISHVRPRLQSCGTISLLVPGERFRDPPFFLLAKPQSLPVRVRKRMGAGRRTSMCKPSSREKDDSWGWPRLTLASLSRSPDEKRDVRRGKTQKSEMRGWPSGLPLDTNLRGHLVKKER